MSILTLGVGGANISVQCQRGGHAAPRAVGSVPSSFAGGLTSSVRVELMVVPVVLTYLTATEAVAIRDLFACGAQVDCQGDIFNNGNAVVTCSGTYTDELLQNANWWQCSLTLYEVGTALL
jgi:hypothetical protein